MCRRQQVMFYFSYDDDRVLILDQEQPEVKSQLWYKDTLLENEIIAEACVCKWYKDIGYE